MTPAPALPDLLQRRLHNQRLTSPTLPTPAAVVEHLLAVQAQDYLGAKWALAQRTPPAAGFTSAQLDQAFARGDFLRTHILRPTWHFVTPADLAWLQALTGPRVQAANAGLCRKLELDAATLKRGLAAITKALRDGRCLTRAELSTVLERARIPATGLRLAYLVMHAELEAVICSGPRRGKQFTYVLVAERAPRARALPRDEALAELARRFIRSRGPCTPRDLAKWSSLTLADCRRAFESVQSQFVSDTFNGETCWFPDDTPSAWGRSPVALLLSNYDEYVSSYADYTVYGDPGRIFNLLDESALRSFVHFLVVNGRIVGLWKRTLNTKSVGLEPLLFQPLTRAAQRALAQAAAPFGRFMQRPATLDG
jgi:hypothetical protein